jgi:ribonuclease Z
MHRLHQELGITTCITVRVAHCQHSFAVILHGTSFGSLAYSGDCRPSHIFADVAKNSDVLIHESTFADELKAEAVLKRHSTVAEALDIAKQMQAKTTLLTHFSQRYPRLPKLPPENTHVIPAFDFMRITPSNIDKCSLMTPLLKMLYPEDSGSEDNGGDEILTESRTTLQQPGYFARQNIL